MHIISAPAPNHPDVIVIRLAGFVDASNYGEVIQAVVDAYESGGRSFLLDLAKVDYISTAGVVALQAAARVARGEYDPEVGWQSVTSIRSSAEVTGKHPNLRLLTPHPTVLRTLEILKLTDYFHIYDDEAQALAAF